MSWAFTFTGKKTAVMKAISEAHAYGDPESINSKQMERAKAFAIGNVEAQADDAVVTVLAHGHADASTQNVFIEVKRIPFVE